MAGISTSGLGSGIDIRSLVDQLVAAEKAPTENRLNRQQQSVQSQLSAYGSLKSTLSSFQNQVKALQDGSSFGGMKANVSNEDALGVSVSAAARSGSYQVEVDALAQSQSLASAAFEKDAVVGGGELTFRFGAVATDAERQITGFDENPARAAKTISIAPGSSVAQIRDAINEADIGVQASIINDGVGDRLVFSSKESGAANGFTIEAEGDAGLAQFAFHEGNSAAELTRAGQDARLTINGLSITRSDNTISDAIEGVTFSLKEVSSSGTRIDINRDKAAATEKIKSFVDAYNKLQQQMTDLTRYDAENQRASALTGNAMVRTLSSNLRNLLTNPVSVLQGGGVTALADLGIISKADGKLEIDAGKLDKAVDQHFDEIGALFNTMGLTGEAHEVEYLKSGKTTQAGNYAVEITQLATQGSYVGSALAAEPTQLPDGRFRIKVDGISSGTINLAQRDYANGAELAAALQAAINDDQNLSDAEVKVSVNFNQTEQRLEIHSQRYGSESSVEILTANADFTAVLGLSVGGGTAGLDVAGRIDGREATGKGQLLTGSGRAEGLELRITGGQIGERGSVTFSRGILGDIDALLSSYLDTDGLLSNTTDSLDGQLKKISQSREELSMRMTSVHERLLSQFIAMDSLLAQMNQTSDFLAQQLANLPKFNK